MQKVRVYEADGGDSTVQNHHQESRCSAVRCGAVRWTGYKNTGKSALHLIAACHKQIYVYILEYILTKRRWESSAEVCEATRPQPPSVDTDASSSLLDTKSRR